MEAYLSNLTVFNHPLIKHKVSHLCDVNTGTKEFSELVKELAMLMGYETLKELKTKDVEIRRRCRRSLPRYLQRISPSFRFCAPASAW